jgi:hypothetical protein
VPDVKKLVLLLIVLALAAVAAKRLQASEA